MAKVEFTYQAGNKKLMAENYARILQKLGRGTYQTRDMRAVPLVPLAPPPEVQEPRVSEAVAEFARENGIDLEKVVGTGKDGRVKKSDVEAVIVAKE